MKKTHLLGDILILTVMIGVFFFIGLGTRPLFVPDEGRYAEIAREMIVNHDFITPYLNGIIYFEKPVLFYWLGAAAIKIGGLNLWSLRSINALLGLAGCLLTYLTARKLYNRTTGLLAAMILATSCLYFVMNHMISLDLPVTIFLSGTLYAFILGTQTSSRRIANRYFYVMAAAAALAVLTKGLIGIVFPVMIIGAWIIIAKQWRLLMQLPIFRCLLIFLLIAAPWHILVNQRHPEFFYFYFIEQHFLRYTTKEIGHYQPAWFFIPTLILGFFPWIVFLPQAIKANWPIQWRANKINQTGLFLLLWPTLIFVFFSFSKSKLIPYILPVIPPLAILTAHYIELVSRQRSPIGFKSGFLVLLMLTMCIAYTFYQFPRTHPLPDPVQAADWLAIAAGILIIGCSTAAVLAWRNAYISILAVIITTALFLLSAFTAVPAIDSRTIQPLAMTLKPLLTTDDSVITYNQYHQDLPFYLERNISVLNWRNELTFGMQHQANHDWLIDSSTFWKQWTSARHVFVILSKGEYAVFKKDKRSQNARILAETIDNILITNR